MDRRALIQTAYKSMGGDATFYDGMITCSTPAGKAVCRLVWDMDQEENDRYLARGWRASRPIFPAGCWRCRWAPAC